MSDTLGGDAPLLSHLLELRTRLMKAMAGVLVVFLPLAFFAQPIFSFIAVPLLAQMPAGTSMIATEVAAPFLTPFKLAMLLAVVLSMPWILYQVWAFVAPGLYKREQRLAVPLLLTSTLLFYLGMAKRRDEKKEIKNRVKMRYLRDQIKNY